MPIDQDELLATFIAEAVDGLSNLENDLLAIEAAGEEIDQDLINKVFRDIHSVKGSSGFCGLTSIGALAHEMEAILNLVRNGELTPTSAIIEALLQAGDALSGMIEDAANSNDTDVSHFIENLKTSMTGESGEEETAENTEEPDFEADIQLPDGTLAFLMISQRELVNQQRQGRSIYVLDVDMIEDVQEKERTPAEFLRAMCEVGEVVNSYVSTAGIGELHDEIPEAMNMMILLASEHSAEVIAERLDLPAGGISFIATPEQTDWSTAPPSPPGSVEPVVESAIQANAESTIPDSSGMEKAISIPEIKAKPPTTPTRKKSQKSSPHPSTTTVAPDATLRVSVKVLDTLMNLAGELVLVRNQLLLLANSAAVPELASVGGKIDRVTSELQEAIMQTRMQTIGTVFNKFPRIVRDLSGSLNKRCSLEINGKDVELDKSIIEMIADPLTHLIRNSVDHGIEMPDVRIDNGKQAAGKVTLSAFHRAGKVVISISDDGAGINAEKLRGKAVEKGIMTDEQAFALSDREAVRLIFHPGFSMAEKVTDVSGRGVGMDVVKTNIEKMGGMVDIDTAVGQGTTITIELPLTLAIIPSLVIRSGGCSFAVAQSNIRELIRVSASEVSEKIQRVRDAEVLRRRGKLLPLVRLDRTLKDSESKPGSQTGSTHDSAPVNQNILVVQAGSLEYGIIVDSLDDSQEIVVKPLGQHMKQCSYLAGATILGDGAVALILDVTGLATLCDLKAIEGGGQDQAAEEKDFTEIQSVLLFTNHPSEQFAVPTALISRIERVRTDQIDSVGGREVVQYRGASLPLIKLEDHITAKEREEQPHLHVVVFDINGAEIGLIAPSLCDIRQLSTNIDTRTFREPGVLGSIILENHPVRFVDLLVLAKNLMPEAFTDQAPSGSSDTDTPAHILLAEDSGFFRNQLIGFLTTDGYKVTDCEDGLIAWNTMQDVGHTFDLVLTDIEMPNMNGLELTERIKGDPAFAHLPVIALTSLASEEDIQNGLNAGVDEYHIKMEREELLKAIAKHLRNARMNSGLGKNSAPQLAERVCV